MVFSHITGNYFRNAHSGKRGRFFTGAASALLLAAFLFAGLPASPAAEPGHMAPGARSFAVKMKAGVELADAKNYKRAYRIFYSLFRNSRLQERRYLALFFACKVLERTGEWKKASDLIDENIAKTPRNMLSDFKRLRAGLKRSLAARK